MINRIPPNNTDAEAAVISALLLNNAGFEDIDGLSPDDFYNGSNKKIFRAMLSLWKQGQPVDPVTVGSELQASGYLESVGVHLAKIADEAPVAVNVGKYAETVKNLSTIRKTIQAAIEIADAGYNAQDVEEYISKSQAEILKIQTTSSQDKFYSMETLMVEAINRIEAAQVAEQGMSLNLGLPTIGSFMQVFGSKLILLAGRPAIGKTALALSIAKFLAYQGVKVGFLSIEMDKEQLADRLLSGEADVNSLCFYLKGSISDQSMRHLNQAAESMYHLPILIDDAECRIQDVERKCRKMKRMGCQIIFIDQLSKIRGQAGQSKFDQYSDNCSAIALLKKELRIPIVLLCQLNRNVEMRDDKTPSLSNLKQTGMLEEDADMVLLLFRPGYYDDDIDESRTKIILAKNRQGAKGVEENVLFHAKRGVFQMGV